MTEQNTPTETDNSTGKKVWFITGAGRGMGTDIAKAALAAGHAVVATGRNPEKVSQAVGDNEDLLAVKLDVTDPADTAAAIQAAVDRFGRIDVLVNNAGNFERTGQTVTAWKGMNGLQGGDPAKLAGALIQLAELDEPPLRFAAGADAVGVFETRGKALQVQADAHRKLSSNLALAVA
ncbi:SDR family NAD(P)-dependent oxidoreductase [Arthrobacter sp. MDT3-24]